MMKKKTIIIFSAAIAAVAAAIVLILLLNNDHSMQKVRCELYFLNEAGTTLVSEEHEVKYYDAENLKENVVLQLIKGPDDARNKRVIGKDVEILSVVTEEDGNVVVNFSEEYQTDDSTKNALSAYAVVKSLCALENVNRVKVVVNGEDLKSDDGTTIGYLTSEDINLPTDTYTSETREIVLYFPRRDSESLYKEKRTVKVTDQQPVEQYIINELISGPQDDMLNPSLGKDTTLLSVDTYEDICFVNFKSNFIEKNSGNGDKEKMAVYSIVNTLTELENIKRVQFLVDGKKAEQFGSMNIKNPFGRNSVIIN